MLHRTVLVTVPYRYDQTCIVFKVCLGKEQHANPRAGSGRRARPPCQIHPLVLAVCELEQVLHFEKRNRHAVIINEGKMLCWVQEAGRFQNKYASPIVGNLVKASGRICTNPQYVSNLLLGAYQALDYLLSGISYDYSECGLDAT